MNPNHHKYPVFTVSSSNMDAWGSIDCTYREKFQNIVT